MVEEEKKEGAQEVDGFEIVEAAESNPNSNIHEDSSTSGPIQSLQTKGMMH